MQYWVDYTDENGEHYAVAYHTSLWQEIRYLILGRF